jgi:hypothetical protein
VQNIVVLKGQRKKMERKLYLHVPADSFLMLKASKQESFTLFFPLFIKTQFLAITQTH